MNTEIDEKMLEEIVKRLDDETNGGAVRVSVNYDETLVSGTNVEHDCCKAYGRSANETVGLLDMYSDCMVQEDSKR